MTKKEGNVSNNDWETGGNNRMPKAKIIDGTVGEMIVGRLLEF